MMATTGTITSVNFEKHYGFIEVVRGPVVFFHRTALVGLEFDEQLLRRRVEFHAQTTAKGPRATSVSPATN